MCIKIIKSDDEQEFSMSEPLENQMDGADEILVSYDPVDPKIDRFLGEVKRLCDNGISCNVQIKVESNNYLNGIKLERELEKLKRKLDVNEVVKGLTKFHADVDKRLRELHEMCVEKINEQ